MLGLIIAGALSLPSLLVVIVTIPLLLVLSAPAAYLLMTRHRPRSRSPDGVSKQADDPYHVIITGGSSGIGLAIATCSMGLTSKAVSKVTLIARNVDMLDAARCQVQQVDESIPVQAVSVDVTDYKAVQEAAFGKLFGPGKQDRVLLFCCAGVAVPERFDQLHPDVFLQHVQLNQLGCMHVAHAFLPYMSSGTICLCSSAAGQVGVFGYTAYSPTKFALRGYAEALHAELIDTSIHVQVAFPPDTDTPGFAVENSRKPKECHLISSTLNLAKPETIGSMMLSSAMARHPPFQVYFDFDGFLLSSLTCGFSPATSFLDTWVQLSGLMTLGRWISLFYLHMWHAIIRQCRTERTSQSESPSSGNGTKGSKHGDRKTD
jgi:3-dehydrosphinganine reductase